MREFDKDGMPYSSSDRWDEVTFDEHGMPNIGIPMSGSGRTKMPEVKPPKDYDELLQFKKENIDLFQRWKEMKDARRKN